MTNIITFSISKQLLEQMDRRRGDIPRSRYITRLLESAMMKGEHKMKEMEITLIEVDQCLTDRCYSCTGYYKNDIFSSRIICKCKCHITKPSNIHLLSVKGDAGPQTIEDEHSSGSQSKKKVLEEVGQPESNTTLRAPDSLKNKGNDTGCRFAEDKDKSFDEDSSRAKRA